MKFGTVALVGRPNSGKSTLLNAIVAQKISIVSDKPQTTRHRILGIVTEARGQIAFVDTPGIHKPGYRMNSRMLRCVFETLRDVDLILLLVDAAAAFGAGDRFVLEAIRRLHPQVLLLINKIDRVAKPKLLPVIARYAKEYDFIEIIPICALTGENVGLVVDRVFDSMPEGSPFYDPDQFTDRGERFLSSELIREKLLERTREEVPYCSAVLIRKFDEARRDKGGLVIVEADILVEKKSQQGIILGEGGLRLRDIGIAARRELERLLGCRIHLALKVRTSPHWRDDDNILDELELGA